MSDDIELGEGYYYVQDYPQCVCKEPKPGKVIVPIGEEEKIVVRIQYNDSIIIATCSSYYFAADSTIYMIEKRTGCVSLINNINTINYFGTKDYKEIKNHYRYKD